MSVTDPILVLDGAVLRLRLADLEHDGPRAGTIELTCPDDAATWLPGLVGESSTVALLATGAGTIDVPDRVALLAHALWARRWWPESAADGIRGPDPAALALEAAWLTMCVEREHDGMLDAFEASAAELLAEAVALAGSPSPTDASAQAETGILDARLASMLADLEADDEQADACALLRARLAGVRQADLALAAGTQAMDAPATIAGGTASVDWAAVPPGTLDAAESTVDWSLAHAAEGAILRVSVRTGAHASGGGVVLVARIAHVEVPLIRSGGVVRGEVRVDEHAIDAIVSAGDAVAVLVGVRGVAAATAHATTRAEREVARSVARARLGAHPWLVAERIAHEALEDW